MTDPAAPLMHRTSPWLAAVLGALAVALIPAAALLARDQSAPFVILESGRGFSELQAAVDAIGEGSGTIEIAPGSYRQCAVQRSGRVTYRAHTPGSVTLAGKACEGKAALVLRGAAATVDGLAFAGINVPDHNGAGIRLEQGPLTVTRSWFRDSEQGIITTNGRDFRLTVDRSTFSRLGTCEGSGGCAHAIYMGDYGELIVTRSRFEAGTGGHYVKSRAARTVIENSSFDDSAGHDTNYMIDLPNGGSGAIRGNWFVQGPDKDNGSTFIALGAEGGRYSSDGLAIEGNDARLAPGAGPSPAFVSDWTGDRLALAGNRLGPGISLLARR